MNLLIYNDEKSQSQQQNKINYQGIIKKLKKQLFLHSNNNVNSNNMTMQLFGEKENDVDKINDYRRNKEKYLKLKKDYMESETRFQIRKEPE